METEPSGESVIVRDRDVLKGAEPVMVPSTPHVTKVPLGNALTREAPASQNSAFGKRFTIAP